MSRVNRAPALIASSLLALPLLLASPSTAEACGGTFCDNTGGIPMPVDQRGEDILFVQNGTQIEVHIRIQYTGEAEHFAWLVPLQAVPEVAVGSDPFFAQLAAATAPRWQPTLEYQCPDEEWENSPPSSTGGFVPDEDFASASEPDLVFEETVGAFEVVVLEGGNAATVMTWLGENGYEQPAEAGPIMQEYIDDGFLLAAVKLTADANVDEIHPLTFTMQGEEPCIPLKLTRIAAEDDMGVRAYFLGQNRWAPFNYKHVELNNLAFPWTESQNLSNSRTAYNQQLSAAVDVAGGRAFTTDYSGDSAIVETFGVYDPSWDETAFIGSDPIIAIQLIALQSLNNHPLIQPLLMEFIPPPDGLDPLVFWNNIEGYADQIDQDAWDDVAFADALASRIIEPGLHAVDLLDAWPQLTRTVTLISPEEMTEDPIFIETPDLEDVSNVKIAEGLDRCGENGSRYLVPWGQNPLPVCMPEEYDNWPEILQQYPARRVFQVAPMGPMQVVENFTQDIVADWTAHQVEQGCKDPEGEEGGGEEGGNSEGGAEGGSGEDAGADEAGGQSGCACSAGDQSPAGMLGFGLALLGLVSVGSRRREQL